MICAACIDHTINRSKYVALIYNSPLKIEYKSFDNIWYTQSSDGASVSQTLPGINGICDYHLYSDKRLGF